MNPYKILGLRKNVSRDDVQKKYRELAKKHHPDHNPGDEKAAAKFRDIQIAYEILYDPKRRDLYDKTGETVSVRAVHQHAEVMKVLGNAMCEVVKQVTVQGFSAKHENIVEHMGKYVRLAISDHKKEIAGLSKTRYQLEEVAKRVKTEDGEDNLLAGAAKSHIAQIDTQIKSLSDLISLSARAIDYLGEYSYDVERIANSVWGSTVAYTLT